MINIEYPKDCTSFAFSDQDRFYVLDDYQCAEFEVLPNAVNAITAFSTCLSLDDCHGVHLNSDTGRIDLVSSCKGLELKSQRTIWLNTSRLFVRSCYYKYRFSSCAVP